MFAAPSSTPPSTPGSGRHPRPEHPSTTPAGPPPSHRTNASFTPAGHPPSSILNSSFLPPSGTTGGSRPFAFLSGQPASGTGQNLFAPNSTPGGTNGSLFAQQGAATGGSKALSSSPPLPQASDDGSDEEEADGMEDEAELEEDEEGAEDADMMEEDVQIQDDELEEEEADGGRFTFPAGSKSLNHFNRSFNTTQNNNSNMLGMSVLSQIRAQTENYSDTLDVNALAKGLCASIKMAGLSDPDDVVMDMEELMEGLELAVVTDYVRKRNHKVYLALDAIRRYLAERSASPNDYDGDGIGPNEESDNVTRVSFVCGLMTQLYQPPPAPPRDDLTSSRFGRSSLASHPEPSAPATHSIPRILLDWLNTHHDTTQPALAQLRDLGGRGFSAHDAFWPTVSAVLLRGRLRDATALLRGADFDVAVSALADGEDQPGYRGARLSAVNRVARRAIQVLDSCPAARDNDDAAWDVWSDDWALFRQRARAALEELQTTAEGESRDRDAPLPPREAGGHNKRKGGDSAQEGEVSFSGASRKAESRVPWSVYEGLQFVYRQLIGDVESLLAAAVDWVEASVALTVWWDCGGDVAAHIHADISRRAHQPDHRRPLLLLPPSPPSDDADNDIPPRDAVIDTRMEVDVYRRRLHEAFRIATAHPDSQFRPDGMSAVEVALACALAGEPEGVARVVQRWSATLGAGVVEMARAGGWTNPASDVVRGLDANDLAVLGFEGRENGDAAVLDVDRTLISYAELLEEEGVFEGQKLRRREGWEMAVRVLGRLDDYDLAKRRVAELVGRVELNTSECVDSMIEMCGALGMPEQEHGVAERYADFLATSSDIQPRPFGSAIHYYARAHSAAKLHDLITLLLTTSLVHSTPFPPLHQLDAVLAHFLQRPTVALAALARDDPAAARTAADALSGYATLRRFYDLRDGRGPNPYADVAARMHGAPADNPPHPSPAGASAAALTSLVAASADRIRGGLLDAAAPPSPVPVDALLALLGEALVFLAPRPASSSSRNAATDGAGSSRHRPTERLSYPQLLALVAAVEDLETVPAGVRAGAERCLAATLAACAGKPSAGGGGGNGKQQSAASSFELLAQSGSSSGGGARTEGSEVLVRSVLGGKADESELEDAERGWDWRRGLREGAGGAEVRRLVRVAVAGEVGRLWGGGGGVGF